jgi:RNA polymerase sigma factor (sigma-70 family)
MPPLFRDYAPQKPIIMSEEKRNEFVERINRHRGLIYWIVKTYGRIESRHDQEDFVQEALISLYTAYNTYRYYPGSNFPAWLTKVVKFSITNYRRYYYRISNWTDYTEDMGEYSQIPDTPGQKDNYEVIKLALAKLPAEDRFVFRMVMNEENLHQNSLNDGKNHGFYSKRFQSVCRKIRYEVYGKPKAKGKKNNARSKPVARMNMLGEILEIYPSTMEAGRSGFNAKNIQHAVAGKRRSCGGFLWKYVDSD